MLPWFLAAASVVLAVASTMYAWNASERARAFSEGAAALQRNLNTLQGSMNVLRARLDIMAAPDVISVNLAGQPEAPAAHARAFMSKTHGMVLTADHLPALAGGRTYQLWVVTKAAPVSVGVFDVNKDGSAVGVMPIAAGATEDPVAVAVTIEPAGGVAAPTGPRVLVGAVEAK